MAIDNKRYYEEGLKDGAIKSAFYTAILAGLIAAFFHFKKK